jgi:hypothetical protein
MLTRILARSGQRSAAWPAGCAPYNGACGFSTEDRFMCSAACRLAHGLRGLSGWHIHHEDYPQQDIYG